MNLILFNRVLEDLLFTSYRSVRLQAIRHGFMLILWVDIFWFCSAILFTSQCGQYFCGRWGIHRDFKKSSDALLQITSRLLPLLELFVDAFTGT